MKYSQAVEFAHEFYQHYTRASSREIALQKALEKFPGNVVGDQIIFSDSIAIVNDLGVSCSRRTYQAPMTRDFMECPYIWSKIVYAKYIDAAQCPQCGHDVPLDQMWYGEIRRVICYVCGMNFDTRFFSKPVWIRQAEVLDNKGNEKMVRPGQYVDILPVRLCKKNEEDGDYFAKQHVEQLRNWLGEGPFQIAWIGIWPCGKIMIYVKTRTSSGAGVYASSLMATR